MRHAKHKHLEKNEKEIVEALKAIGFIQVKDNGWTDHVDEAERILFYHPEIKKGLDIWLSDPGDQQVFDEYYMQEVNDKFGTKIIGRN